MTSLNEISLYEIMAEDWEVRLVKQKTGGYDLMLLLEDEQECVEEDDIHQDAIDSLAIFCRRFLEEYRGVNRGEI